MGATGTSGIYPEPNAEWVLPTLKDRFILALGQGAERVGLGRI